MKHVLQKDNTQLHIKSLGAELCSLTVDSREIIWPGNEQWWPRHSPVLFPLIGKSRGDQIHIDGKDYAMAQHGFARDMEFLLDETKSTASTIGFVLYDSGESLQKFPFPFELHLNYTLLKNGVHLHYKVFNPGNRPLPFALGAHPAFILPETGFKDLALNFSEIETGERHLLKNGLFNGETHRMGEGLRLILNESQFESDAIVFKGIKSRKVQLTGPEYNLEMQFGGFTDFGIWTKQGCSDFLCLEPWYGFADSTKGPIPLEKRPGIHLLESGQAFEAFWQVRFSS